MNELLQCDIGLLTVGYH